MQFFPRNTTISLLFASALSGCIVIGGGGNPDGSTTPGPDGNTTMGDASMQPGPEGGTMGTEGGMMGTEGGTTPMCPAGGCPSLTELSLGNHTSCALTSSAMYCWGNNSDGNFGDGTTMDRRIPRQVSPMTDFARLFVGYDHSCGIKRDNSVWCWGGGTNGQLGNGMRNNSNTPVQVTGLTGVTNIAFGQYSTCALKMDGTVWCWGRGGELGVSSINTSDVPQQVTGLTDVIHFTMADGSMYSSGSTACAVKRNGTVWCWGDNRNGQLGTGTLDSSRTPVELERITGAIAVEAGGTHTCALMMDRSVQCWGGSDETGTGSRDRVLRPTPVPGLTNVQRIVVGAGYTFAILMDGSVRGFGRNNVGQLALGTRLGAQAELMPVPIPALNGARLIDAGFDHACAYFMGGSTMCWGNGTRGGLGNDTEMSSTSPSAVLW